MASILSRPQWVKAPGLFRSVLFGSDWYIFAQMANDSTDLCATTVKWENFPQPVVCNWNQWVEIAY